MLSSNAYVVSISCITNGGIIEKEMVYNQDVFLISTSIAFRSLKSWRKEKQKTLFRDNFFHFQCFGFLEI